MNHFFGLIFAPAHFKYACDMRYLLFIFSLLTASLLQAQEEAPTLPVNEEGMIMYREVVTQDGPADSLYHRAIGWINAEFSNPSDVTRVRDRENATLRGTARLSITGQDAEGAPLSAGLVEYGFTIECRDGRYRYTFTDFLHKRSSRFPLERWLDKEDPQYSAAVETYLQQVDQHIRQRIQSLKQGMQPGKKVIDEW